MRLVIVSAPHMVFAPYMLTALMTRRAQDIAALVLIEAKAGKEARGVIGRAGWRYFLMKGLDHLLLRIATRMEPDVDSLQGLATRLGIRVIRTANVNSEETLAQLRELAPDVLLSAFAPQIFKRPLIGIPSRACINVHPSLLPAYAGIAPVFWVLANGETRTGVTLHHIAPKVDAGDILAQASLEIEAGDTVRSLYLRVCRLGADLLVDAIDALERGELARQVQDPARRSRFGNPDRDGYRQLRERGRRLF